MTTEHQNGAHLEYDPECVPDVIGMELFEALGAVPTLEEESIAHGGLAQAFLQVAGFSGEHNGRESFEGAQHRLEFLLIRVLRQLQRLLRLPAVHGPFRGSPLGLDRGGGGGGCGCGGGRGDRSLGVGRVGGVDGGDGFEYGSEGERGRGGADLGMGLSNGGRFVSEKRIVGRERHCRGVEGQMCAMRIAPLISDEEN